MEEKKYCSFLRWRRLPPHVPLKNQKYQKPIQQMSKSIVLPHGHKQTSSIRNLFLNGLTDELYDYYNTMSIAKKVWDTLQKKYDIEEARSKKYAISWYFQYQMTDDISVEAQSHEIYKIDMKLLAKACHLMINFRFLLLLISYLLCWKTSRNSKV